MPTISLHDSNLLHCDIFSLKYWWSCSPSPFATFCCVLQIHICYMVTFLHLNMGGLFATPFTAFTVFHCILLYSRQIGSKELPPSSYLCVLLTQHDILLIAQSRAYSQKRNHHWDKRAYENCIHIPGVKIFKTQKKNETKIILCYGNSWH